MNLIIGAGAFGTALACRIPAKLFSIEPDVVQEINERHSNRKYLDMILPKSLTATDDISSVSKAKLILLCVPSHALVTACETMKPHYKGQPIIAVSKGISENGLVPTEVISKLLGTKKVYPLMGPSIAGEVAKGNTVKLLLGGSRAIAKQLNKGCFIVEYSKDIKGMQLLSAFKNILAITAGLCEGLKLSNNFRAALLSTAFSRFFALNKRWLGPEVLLSVAGLGDLIVTIESRHSRNHRFGQFTAQGASPQLSKKLIGQVVEGYETLLSLRKSNHRHFDQEFLTLLHKAITAKDAVKKRKHLQAVFH